MTFGDLKSRVRAVVFPAGEAQNLTVAHDKFMLDALIDLQTWVECKQQNNTDVRPQCATLYRCGLTVTEAPRGRIKRLLVVDNLDSVTGRESAAGATDYCGEVEYTQIDPCHIRHYMRASVRAGCCLPFHFLGCHKPWYPTPTDAGLPAGLAALPLGFHYPQASTDRSWGRARAGVWAIENGSLFVAPWIQSAETLLIKWDGIKRAWTPLDQLEDDPLLEKAVEEYLRWQHAAKYDRDEAEAARAQAAYNETRSFLMHECREETRVRGCEPSLARGAPGSISNLFYNEEQSASADCPDGTTSATYTVAAGTIASTVSVADANQKAKDEAQRQAQSRLVCVSQTPSYTNAPKTATVSCQGEDGAPTPAGSPVTVTVPAGTITSTVSQADADQQADALAQTQAAAQLSCTFWNASQSVTLTCATDGTITVTKTVAASTYSSAISQADADAKAKADAQSQATAALALVCTGQPTVFWNTALTGQYEGDCTNCFVNQAHIRVLCRVAAHYISAPTQLLANQLALNAANQRAFQVWQQLCSGCRSGTGDYLTNLP